MARRVDCSCGDIVAQGDVGMQNGAVSAFPSIVTWRTDAVEPRHRTAYYADALSAALAPMQMAYDGPRDGFRAEMAMTELGLVAVLRQAGTAHRAFREQRDLARATERTYHLVLNRSSAWKVAHRSLSCLDPGDAMLFDSALDTDMRLDNDYDVVHIKLAETWIRQWLPVPGALVGQRIPATSGWGRALTSFAAQLSPHFVARAPLPLSIIADHIGGLLAFAANEVDATVARRPSRAESALFTRIDDLIVQRCADPGLTATHIASFAGVSLRTLHRSLASQRRTFGALLIDARYQLALRMLKSPAFRRLTIAQVSHRAGFVDPSHFARVVRSRCGCTPSRLRIDTSVSSFRNADRLHA